MAFSEIMKWLGVSSEIKKNSDVFQVFEIINTSSLQTINSMHIDKEITKRKKNIAYHSSAEGSREDSLQN